MNTELKHLIKCPDCNGFGEVSTYEMIDEVHRAPVGVEACSNCNGTGEEQDEEKILDLILENLNEEQESKLKDKCFGDNPQVLDDDMPDFFDNWLAEQKLLDITTILYPTIKEDDEELSPAEIKGIHTAE